MEDSTMTVRRILGVWSVICVAMIGNGIVREVALVPLLKRTAADIVSAALGIVIVLGVTRLFLRRFAGRPVAHPGRVALAWLGLTVGFEFLFGHYVDGKSWGELVVNYAIWRGRLWPVVLLAAVMAPFLWTRWVGGARSGALPGNRQRPSRAAMAARRRGAA
jgi:hypothetical protein